MNYTLGQSDVPYPDKPRFHQLSMREAFKFMGDMTSTTYRKTGAHTYTDLDGDNQRRAEANSAVMRVQLTEPAADTRTTQETDREAAAAAAQMAAEQQSAYAWRQEEERMRQEAEQAAAASQATGSPPVDNGSQTPPPPPVVTTEPKDNTGRNLAVVALGAVAAYFAFK